MVEILRNETITGIYAAYIQDIRCELKLRFDATGCLTGAFSTTDEHLEVMGGVPNVFGNVFGLIREPNGDTLAVFRASPHGNNLMLEIDLPKDDQYIKLADIEAAKTTFMDQMNFARSIVLARNHHPPLNEKT